MTSTSAFVHPEYFVTNDGKMYFGEVAYRIRDLLKAQEELDFYI